MTVVTLGEAMLRLSPARGDRLGDADRVALTVGGAESNVAVALAALGVPSAWLGALPRNALGDRVVAELAAAGVDTSYVVRRDGARVGLYFVELPVSPRPALVHYDRSRSAATEMTPKDIHADALAGATHAVVSGITAALEPYGASLSATFLALAGGHGVRRVVDINFRRQLWQPVAAARILAELAREADVLVCSAEDARTVFGIEGDGPQIASALRTLAPSADLVVVTLGDRGASAWSAGLAPFTVEPVPVEVIDPLGAGDALVAGLIWAERRGSRPDRQVAAGVTMASLACTVRGDHARFDSALLEAVLDGVSLKGLR